MNFPPCGLWLAEFDPMYSVGKGLLLFAYLGTEAEAGKFAAETIFTGNKFTLCRIGSTCRCPSETVLIHQTGDY